MKNVKCPYCGYTMPCLLYTSKPKFRETVYKMLERGENAPAVSEQLKTVAEKYEEYFNPAESSAPPSSPQFGAEVKGQMPSGKTGTAFEDVWGLGKK